MTDDRYPEEILSEDDDCGIMPDNVQALRDAVVGHRIVKAEKRAIDNSDSWSRYGDAFVITLDNGKEVRMYDTSDCCAGTSLERFLLNVDKVDHIILGVGTTEYYTKWHIYADWGDVMELEVGWSCGNPFYYGYGFDIEVVDMDGNVLKTDRDD